MYTNLKILYSATRLKFDPNKGSRSHGTARKKVSNGIPEVILQVYVTAGKKVTVQEISFEGARAVATLTHMLEGHTRYHIPK